MPRLVYVVPLSPFLYLVSKIDLLDKPQVSSKRDNAGLHTVGNATLGDFTSV